MTFLRIKICGVKDANTACNAIALGAHYIGLIFHPTSKRYVTPAQAAEIAEATRNADGIPVGVFVNHSHDEIISICQQTKINMVQLHGANASRAQDSLPAHISRIFVLHVSTDGKIVNENDLKLASLSPKRDYLLFDNPLDCNGHEINLQQIDLTSFKFKYFIAGGLNHCNVKKFTDSYLPFGVDVCSLVENEHGQKDLNLIKEFITGATQ